MITETIDLLGRRATCKVTGFTGVIESVCFDLYGCVQAAVKPPLDEKGDPRDGRWHDVQRLTIDMTAEPVMARPDFAARPSLTPKTYDRGPADKAPTRSSPTR